MGVTEHDDRSTSKAAPHPTGAALGGSAVVQDGNPHSAQVQLQLFR